MKKIVAKPSFRQIDNVGHSASSAEKKQPSRSSSKARNASMDSRESQGYGLKSAALKDLRQIDSSTIEAKSVENDRAKGETSVEGTPIRLMGSNAGDSTPADATQRDGSRHGQKPMQGKPEMHAKKPASKKGSMGTSKEGAEPASMPKKSGSKYIPALDGLRAFAVIAVVLYHMSTSVLPGGLLGVTLFFVLSGYLITGILIREWSQTGKIDLPRFWIHRVRRLFPAIFFMVCSVLVITAFVAPDLLTKLRNDLFAALFWFTNWWYIFQDLSYFEAMGAPSPVTHFWSLAIEEQFYVVWPPLLLLLFHNKVKKESIQKIILALAVVSVVLMALLFVPGGDPSRVYYGTDTRAFSLLIGAFLAFVLPAHRVRGHGRKGLNPQQRKVVGVAGIACCAGIVVMMALVDGYAPFMYYGGILIVSLLTGGLVIALVDPRNAISRVFSVRPLVYIGKISYGIYIWHYPILLLMTDFNTTAETPVWWYLVEAAVILGVSAFSYHFVEQPIRKGCIGRILESIRNGQSAWKGVIAKHVPQLACAFLLVVGATVACIVTPYTTTQSHTYDGGAVVPEGALAGGDGALGSAGQESEQYRSYLLEGLGTNACLESLSTETLELLAATGGNTAAEKAHNTSFILVGDSVTAAFTSEYYGDFSGMFPNAILDSEKNRTMSQGVDVMRSYFDQGWNGPVVVLELGTNSLTTKSQFEEMVSSIPEGKMIFMINIRAKGDHVDATNSMLQELASEHNNIEVIDWYSVSAGHDEYFDGDGTHLTPSAGSETYQNMILKALETLYRDTPATQGDEGAQDQGDSGDQASA